jgi:hypothetical protein
MPPVSRGDGARPAGERQLRPRGCWAPAAPNVRFLDRQTERPMAELGRQRSDGRPIAMAALGLRALQSGQQLSAKLWPKSAYPVCAHPGPSAEPTGCSGADIHANVPGDGGGWIPVIRKRLARKLRYVARHEDVDDVHIVARDHRTPVGRPVRHAPARCRLARRGVSSVPPRKCSPPAGPAIPCGDSPPTPAPMMATL